MFKVGQSYKSVCGGYYILVASRTEKTLNSNGEKMGIKIVDGHEVVKIPGTNITIKA